MPARSGLGKGLDALIPGGSGAISGAGAAQVPIDSSRTTLASLARVSEKANCRNWRPRCEHGILQPLVVAPARGGAALDVFETEPLPDDSPLRDEALTPVLRLFPHAASAARATRLSPDPDVGMAGRCVQGAIDVLEGRYGGDPKQMPFVVNKDAF